MIRVRPLIRSGSILQRRLIPPGASALNHHASTVARMYRGVPDVTISEREPERDAVFGKTTPLSGLKRDGGKVLALLEEYYANMLAQPDGMVSSTLGAAKAGDVARLFATDAPEKGRKMDDILDEVKGKMLPYSTHWQHPHFMAYYPASISSPAILGETLLSGLGNLGLQWASNPVGTELEVVVMDWLCRLVIPSDGPVSNHFLHTSGKGGGIIQHVAGEAVLNVVTCAKMAKIREIWKKENPDASPSGDPYRTTEEMFYHPDICKLVFYTSSHAHFCIPKACRIAGVRCRQVKPQLLEETGNFGVVPRDVEAAIEEDIKNGLIPAGILLNFGTTNTCGYDRIGSFKQLKQKHKLWIHCDAAYAGPALMLPEFRKNWGQQILETCTSFNFNCSKWFMSGFDSALLYTSERRLMTSTMGAEGSYMQAPENEAIYAPEFKDWAIPLGRRFRSLRLWLVLNHFGVDGIRQFLRTGIKCGDVLRKKLERKKWKYHQPVKTDLGLVCFQLRQVKEWPAAVPVEEDAKVAAENGAEGDVVVGNPEIVLASQQAHDGLIAHLKANNFFILPSILHGEPMIRVAMGGILTEEEHVEKLWELMELYRW